MADNPYKNIVSKYGSMANFYIQVAKETGTTPEQVLNVAGNMESQNMQPQNEIQNANAQTPVSQVTRGPIPMSANKVGAQAGIMQQQGVGQAQAMNAAATNPENKVGMATGGGTALPDPPPQSAFQNVEANPPTTKEINDIAKANGKTGLPKEQPKTKTNSSDAQMLDMFDNALKTIEIQKQQQQNTETQQNGGNAPERFLGFSKGGDTSMHNKIASMPLHQVLKMLATHPGLAGQGQQQANPPLQGMNMKFGGGVHANHDPDAKDNHYKEGRSPGLAIAEGNMNVGTYASGGIVEDSEVQNNDSGSSGKGSGLIGMANGGGTDQLEEDQITGYAPDGTPIIQNSDGSVSYGDVNQLIDRPEGTSTLGTGATPKNSSTTSAANAPMQQMSMAKGGEDAPPGALKNEVSDQIPAQLSEGEFVFSADATRFWGLQKLQAMMQYARQELDKMQQSGGIRSPGDGKNPDEQGIIGQFMQDSEPNANAYTPEEKGEDNDEVEDQDQDGMKSGGPVNYGKAKGGLTKMAYGGGTQEEDQYKKGGQVDHQPSGTSNILTSHPQGGSNIQDYDRGGIVSSAMSSLSPKKDEYSVPTTTVKTSAPKISSSGPHIQIAKNGVSKFEVKAPKVKRGGLLRDVNQQANYIGS